MRTSLHSFFFSIWALLSTHLERISSCNALVCSRLLHHVEDPASRIRLLSELARVTRMGMVVTFFDARSFSALRRKRVAAQRGRPSARFSMTRAQCASEASSAGLELVGMKAMLRYYAEVTAAVFVKD